ncbi:MAG: hypothetical protein WBG44_08095, partial [Comamonas sp.]
CPCRAQASHRPASFVLSKAEHAALEPQHLPSQPIPIQGAPHRGDLFSVAFIFAVKWASMNDVITGVRHAYRIGQQ